MSPPERGEIWLADFSPTRGHEQSGRHPALIVSADGFNHGPAGLVVAVPLTSVAKRVPSHVKIEPPEGGLTSTSYAKCEDVRSMAKERLIARWGRVTAATMSEVQDRLRVLMAL